MARKFTRVERDVDLMETQGDDESRNINWDLCALCQNENKEHLICPANRGGAGYVYVAQRLDGFRTLGSCPIPVDPSKLDEGQGLLTTFEQHAARWHKKCRSSIDKLQVKRKQEDHSLAQSPAKTRKTHEVSDRHEVTCIFCNEPGNDKHKLHRTWTLGLDYKVRNCSEYLQDNELIGKLSSGDMVATDSAYHLICLTNLYKRAENAKTTTDSDDLEK